MWRVKTKLCTPKTLASPKPRVFLSPSEQWTVFQNVLKIPKNAYMPKLHLDGSQPMKRVMMEQQRRDFSRVNIPLYLETECGVTYEELVPPNQNNVLGHFLPLELFDDKEFESRTEEEWLSLGEVEGVKHPVPALVFIAKRKSMKRISRAMSSLGRPASGSAMSSMGRPASGSLSFTSRTSTKDVPK
ncbi:dynein axonemal heavy chain 1-like [Macrosteles quadrilineatus]|uniref:dynein axonemal heavy chain 1-like n=1 Tax=Macrosteles quadrilineatus TaxID=74068 RepID=UPI0023E30785|nr:dynein axonemal heavy chain 1-like [Macrosteles quadrilineatus]